MKTTAKVLLGVLVILLLPVVFPGVFAYGAGSLAYTLITGDDS